MPQSTGRIEGTLKNLLPTGRRILIRPHETPDYKGSILIPESAKTVAPTTGIIACLGFELQDDETNRLREGDTVVYSRYAGVELKFDDGHRVMIIHEDDVLGVLHGADLKIGVLA